MSAEVSEGTVEDWKDEDKIEEVDVPSLIDDEGEDEDEDDDQDD